MADYSAYAVACIEALHAWYNRENGLWKSMGWWNAANAIEASGVSLSHPERRKQGLIFL